MDSANKWLRLPIPLVMAGAAIVGLIIAIFLIFTNPSRFPQGVTTTFPTLTTISPTIENPAETGGSDQKKITQMAIASLAKKLGVTSEQIKISSAQNTNWPDASLGCPQPGQVYAQVITPGYEITLQAQGETYTYHADTSKRVFLCDRAVNE